MLGLPPLSRSPSFVPHTLLTSLFSLSFFPSRHQFGCCGVGLGRQDEVLRHSRMHPRHCTGAACAGERIYTTTIPLLSYCLTGYLNHPVWWIHTGRGLGGVGGAAASEGVRPADTPVSENVMITMVGPCHKNAPSSLFHTFQVAPEPIAGDPRAPHP